MKDVEREAVRQPWSAAVEEITRKFEKVADSLAAAMATITASLRRHDPTLELAQRRTVHGGMGGDAVRWPDCWYSVHCTAWLCGECPSDKHELRCTCHCHGGAR